MNTIHKGLPGSGTRTTTPATTRLLCALLLAILPAASPPATAASGASAAQSCFLLWKVGTGEIRRDPAPLCDTRLSPASTFKVPHALAALDSGVIATPEESMDWDGTGQWAESARRPHTLASAIRDSVVWYFQRIAVRLGMEREREYLEKYEYGNRDASSGLTTFWLGQSLEITPVEQLAFWRKLYSGSLPAKARSMDLVRQMLIQPRDTVVDARGWHRFAAPWPPDAVVSTKTGATTDRSGQVIRWLAGHVARKDGEYLFVSAVRGPDVEGDAAIDLAAAQLRQAGVL